MIENKGSQGDIFEFSLSPSNERYYSNDTYYGVYEFSTSEQIPHTKEAILFDDNSSTLNIGVIAGTTGKLEYGVEYKVKAQVEYNAKYRSWQYKPVEIVPVVPTKIEQAEKFLRSLATKNQTTALLEKYPNIVDMIINREEVDLTDIKGIKEKTFDKIKSKVESTYGMMELTVFLNPLGVSTKAIEKLFESGTSSKVIKDKIKENPYMIANIKGFGFSRADDIALKLSPHLRSSKYRAVAYIKFLLNDVASKHGHTWVSIDKFLESCRNNIPECKEFIFEIIRDENSKWLYVNRELKIIGLRTLYNLELEIAKEIIRLRDGVNHFAYGNVDEKIKNIEGVQGWEFTNEQLGGVKLVMDKSIIAVTGLGGTGKSSVARAMTEMLDNYKIAQVALSGKAALRLQEVTGRPGSTIHRLLGFKDGKFIHNKSNPLEIDVVVIDEASMIGADLFYKLLQAIPTGAKVIVMGDCGQLESIGVGSVFKDMLDSGIVPVVNLTEIHRQAKKSAIITESINIRHQKHIIDKDFYGTRTLGELKDLHLDIYEDKDETSGKIIDYFKKEYIKSNDVMEIQVIVPTRERVYNLNNKIQEIVNPANKNKMEINLNLKKGMPYVIRVGDKVMNMANQYDTKDVNNIDLPVFNGNLGIVKSIYTNYMIVNFIGIGELVIDKQNWKHIELGYASTCHKFQGSQVNTVIVGVDSSSYVMLSKEWLYTAITRSVSMCYLCGDNYAVRASVKKSNLVKKLTHLKELLVEQDYLNNN